MKKEDNTETQFFLSVILSDVTLCKNTFHNPSVFTKLTHFVF